MGNADRKMRKCLRCGDMFDSKWKGNRICSRCHILNKMGSNYILNRALSFLDIAQADPIKNPIKKERTVRG